MAKRLQEVSPELTQLIERIREKNFSGKRKFSHFFKPAIESIRKKNYARFSQGHELSIITSADEPQIQALLNALEIGDVDHAIFLAPDLPVLTVTAFKQGRLAETTASTLLYYAEATKNYHGTVKLALASRDNDIIKNALCLTPEDLAVEGFDDFPQLNPLSETKQHELFDLIEQQSPANRLFFYTEDAERKENRLDSFLHHRSIPARLKENGVCRDVYFGVPLVESINQVRFGWTPRARPYPGALTTRQILAYRKDSSRPINLAVEGVSSIKSAHGISGDEIMVTNHDILHTIGIASSPRKIFLAFNHLIDCIRRDTGLEMSKEIWAWTDFANSSLFNKTDDNPTQLFLALLLSEDDEVFSWRKLLYYDDKLAPAAWILLFDLLKNPEKWQEDFDINAADIIEHIGARAHAILGSIDPDMPIINKILIATILDYLPEEFHSHALEQLLSHQNEWNIRIVKSTYQEIKNQLEINTFMLSDLDLYGRIDSVDQIKQLLKLQCFASESPDFLPELGRCIVPNLSNIITSLDDLFFLVTQFQEIEKNIIECLRSNALTNLNINDTDSVSNHMLPQLPNNKLKVALIMKYPQLIQNINDLTRLLPRLQDNPELKEFLIKHVIQNIPLLVTTIFHITDLLKAFPNHPELEAALIQHAIENIPSLVTKIFHITDLLKAFPNHPELKAVLIQHAIENIPSLCEFVLDITQLLDMAPHDHALREALADYVIQDMTSPNPRFGYGKEELLSTFHDHEELQKALGDHHPRFRA